MEVKKKGEKARGFACMSVSALFCVACERGG